MIPLDINVWAVAVSAIAAMIIGALWFSPILFGTIWSNLMGFTSSKMEEMKKGSMAKFYAAGFLLEVVTAVVLYKVMGIAEITEMVVAINLAGLLWLGFMVPLILSGVLWENKPMKLVFIVAAHRLVTLVVMAAITSYFI